MTEFAEVQQPVTKKLGKEGWKQHLLPRHPTGVLQQIAFGNFIASCLIESNSDERNV